MCNSDNDWQTSRKSCNNGLFSICPINSAAYHCQTSPIDTKIGTKTVKRNFQRKRYLDQLYILIGVWVLQTAIVVQNMPFQNLLCKKTKKHEICWKIQQKMSTTSALVQTPKRWSKVLFNSCERLLFGNER